MGAEPLTWGGWALGDLVRESSVDRDLADHKLRARLAQDQHPAKNKSVSISESDVASDPASRVELRPGGATQTPPTANAVLGRATHAPSSRSLST